MDYCVLSSRNVWILTVLVLAGYMVCLGSPVCLADVFSDADNKLSSVRDGIIMVLRTVGVIAVLVCAGWSLLTGRWPWARIGTAVGGLFLALEAKSLVEFFNN